MFVKKFNFKKTIEGSFKLRPFFANAST